MGELLVVDGVVNELFPIPNIGEGNVDSLFEMSLVLAGSPNLKRFGFVTTSPSPNAVSFGPGLSFDSINSGTFFSGLPLLVTVTGESEVDTDGFEAGRTTELPIPNTNVGDVKVLVVFSLLSVTSVALAGGGVIPNLNVDVKGAEDVKADALPSTFPKLLAEVAEFPIPNTNCGVGETPVFFSSLFTPSLALTLAYLAGRGSPQQMQAASVILFATQHSLHSYLHQ